MPAAQAVQAPPASYSPASQRQKDASSLPVVVEVLLAGQAVHSVLVGTPDVSLEWSWHANEGGREGGRVRGSDGGATEGGRERRSDGGGNLAVSAVDDEYLPAGQSSHAAAVVSPGESEYLPAMHAVHVPPAGP